MIAKMTENSVPHWLHGLEATDMESISATLPGVTWSIVGTLVGMPAKPQIFYCGKLILKKIM